MVEKAECMLIEAGHCPHDELPEVFNKGIVQFLDRLVDRQGTGEEEV